MATIKINPSTVTCTEKVAAQLCSILAENGIQFSFVPGKYKIAIDKKDILISQMQMSVRAARAIRNAVYLWKHKCVVILERGLNDSIMGHHSAH